MVAINRVPADTEEKLRRLGEHCAVTSAAFDIAARDLSSGDIKRQSEAADRMIGLAAHHSWDDIMLCAKTLPLFDGRDQCWLRKDYRCLERMARAASEVTNPGRIK